QPVRTPRESARILYDDTASGLKTGLLFGGERAGLETGDIALCAGITTYSPLRQWGTGPGKKVGIVGLGGLGHMGVKLAR
ncbi:hypothetical protein AADX85_16340, partial [Staphylococcus epidermidis]